jgi:hypothetical protein
MPALPATRGASVRIPRNLQQFCIPSDIQIVIRQRYEQLIKACRLNICLPLINYIVGIRSIIIIVIAMVCE